MPIFDLPPEKLIEYQGVEMGLTKNAYDDLTYFFRQFDPRHEKRAGIF